MSDGLESDIGRIGGVWRPLGDVLAVLEEFLGVLEAFESLLRTSCVLAVILAVLEASWKRSIQSLKQADLDHGIYSGE